MTPTTISQTPSADETEWLEQLRRVGYRAYFNGYRKTEPPCWIDATTWLRQPLDQPPREEPLLGVELEIEHPSPDARAITIGYWHAECPLPADAKHDGSLTDYGVELAFWPTTLRAWQQLRDTFERYSDLAAGYLRARSHDGGHCGLHVHLCDGQFRSQAHRARLLLLVNQHADWWRRVARRRPNDTYARFALITTNEALQMARAKAHRETGYWSRYVAVNFASRGTIELRLWRGTLKPESFYTCLELSDALLRYCAKKRPLDPASLCAWIQERPELYPETPRYLRDRGLWPLPEEQEQPKEDACQPNQ